MINVMTYIKLRLSHFYCSVATNAYFVRVTMDRLKIPIKRLHRLLTFFFSKSTDVLVSHLLYCYDRICSSYSIVRFQSVSRQTSVA